MDANYVIWAIKHNAMGKGNPHAAKNGIVTRFKKGKVPKGGRKPVAIELKAREFILKCINGEKGAEELVAKIYSQAMKGAYKQQELLMNYILGRPVEKLKIDSAYGPSTVMSAPVIKIIADTLRLQRLEKDAAEPVMDEDRIVEAERVLEEAISNGATTLNGNGKHESKISN